MSKNAKILYCILGSALLALLNSPIFSNSMLGMYQSRFLGGRIGSYLEYTIRFLINILSLAGFVSLIIFSIILIISNINLKGK